jgi:hypothetical protein
MRLQFTKNIGSISSAFVCDTDVQDLATAQSLAIRNDFVFDLGIPDTDPKVVRGIKIKMADLFSFLILDSDSQAALPALYKLADASGDIKVTEMSLSASGRGFMNIHPPTVDSGLPAFPQVGCGFSFISGFTLAAADIVQVPDPVLIPGKE